MTPYSKKNWLIYLIFFAVIIVVTIIALIQTKYKKEAVPVTSVKRNQPDYWIAPTLDSQNIPGHKERTMIVYGKDLIANTSKYFGPLGSVKAVSNGMNCQNCHLDAGTRPWGNNYSAVASTYPKFRERSGAIESIPKRVNDCFERSLNGKAIDTAGYEMKSIVAYFQWLGQHVKKGEKPKGSGIADLKYLDRAADPANGKIVYTQKCQSCHGADGAGFKNIKDSSYSFPPLWGEHSYNTGAGLFRLSRFAGYVKDNMPFKLAKHETPVLSDEEAWDVAAFVNSQPRPKGNIKKDWPNISAKPIDHPFGPYDDGFTEEQHKYGPFQPIVDERNKMKQASNH
jgi:thiosulfate dehydrogenase